LSEALFLTNDEQIQIKNLYTQIFIENNKDDYELDLLMAYANLIFTYIGKCYKRQFTTRQPLYNKIVLEFKKLLESYYIDKSNELPTVHFFAEKLNLSTNYFGDLVKHYTAKNASEIIQESVIAKAKTKLKSSDETIAEIGYHLGFEYPTYFSRLFKKHTGQTPSQFRK
jgi:AraC-like DNA-binding protein